jgi:hypothetical protein
MNTEDRILWTTLCASVDDVPPPLIRSSLLSAHARNALHALLEKLRPQLELLGMNTAWSREDVLRLLGIETKRRSVRAPTPSSPRWKPSDAAELPLVPPLGEAAGRASATR